MTTAIAIQAERARIVAEYWRDALMDEGEIQAPMRLGAHPLACVLMALNGEETAPEQLGVKPSSKAGKKLAALATRPRELSPDGYVCLACGRMTPDMNGEVCSCLDSTGGRQVAAFFWQGTVEGART